MSMSSLPLGADSGRNITDGSGDSLQLPQSPPSYQNSYVSSLFRDIYTSGEPSPGPSDSGLFDRRPAQNPFLAEVLGDQQRAYAGRGPQVASNWASGNENFPSPAAETGFRRPSSIAMAELLRNVSYGVTQRSLQNLQRAEHHMNTMSDANAALTKLEEEKIAKIIERRRDELRNLDRNNPGSQSQSGSYGTISLGPITINDNGTITINGGTTNQTTRVDNRVDNRVVNHVDNHHVDNCVDNHVDNEGETAC